MAVLDGSDVLRPQDDSSRVQADLRTPVIDVYEIADVALQLSPSHPLYIHPNDHPGMLLISEVLSEFNFTQWQRGMTIALSSKLKLGMVDGSNPKPSSQSKYFMAWKRCNDMVISWLLNSLSSEIRSSVVYFPTAHEIWCDLTNRFRQGNAPQIYQIRKEIAALTQGNMSVTAYFTRFRSLWGELLNVSSTPKCICTCVCDAKRQIEEHDEIIKVTQFLMGLNDAYTSIRGTILAMTPFPTISQALSLITQDERQRSGSSNPGVNVNIPDAATALLAKSNTYSRSSTGPRKFDKSVSKVNLLCDHCGGTGHLKDHCFFLHGFPEWHRLHGVKPDPSKMPKLKMNAATSSMVPASALPHKSFANNVVSNDAASSRSDFSSGFTDAHFAQFIEFLKTQESGASSHASVSGFQASYA